MHPNSRRLQRKLKDAVRFRMRIAARCRSPSTRKLPSAQNFVGQILVSGRGAIRTVRAEGTLREPRSARRCIGRSRSPIQASGARVTVRRRERRDRGTSLPAWQVRTLAVSGVIRSRFAAASRQRRGTIRLNVKCFPFRRAATRRRRADGTRPTNGAETEGLACYLRGPT